MAAAAALNRPHMLGARLAARRRPQTTAAPTAQRQPALRQPARRCWQPPTAKTAAAGGFGDDGLSKQQHKRHNAALPAMFQALSDPAANRKLLALSFAQMLSSIATLLHDTYLPLYMSEVLKMSNTRMGNLHGLLQFLSRASGVISGRLADVLSPARMVIIGVGLTALVCKPSFALVGSVYAWAGAAACAAWITYAKMFDRIIKGVRETPSKALVGELAAQSGDSAAGAFSVRQALSTLGMLLGSGAAALAFQMTGRSYEATFALSVIPAIMGLLLVAVALGGDAKPTHAHDAHDEGAVQLSLPDKMRALWSALPRGYWQALVTMCILYGARFDVAFITVHAATVMDRASLPMLTFFSMAPVILLATPMGMRAKASVKARNTVLTLGIAVLVLGDLCYALIPNVMGMILGSTAVGVHMAMTQGVMFGMLASYIPNFPLPGLGRVSGIAWSFTDLILGVALAYSNSLAGRLTDLTVARGMGTTGCFMGGAVVSLVSILALLAFSAFGDLGKEPQVKAPGGAAPKAA